MKKVSETFYFTSEVDTKDYVKTLQTKVDELADLVNHASTHIPDAEKYAEGTYPIWEYVRGENYTSLFAVMALITNADELDGKPERLEEIIDLINKD
jgi:hypothetical protein